MCSTLRGQLKLEELRGRPIRVILTGVTIPLDGYDDKRIYVWYDAVIGYTSAAVSGHRLRGAEAWREWWDAGVNPEALIYNFIGKDNIPFHTIIWPGMLMGYNAPELGDDGEQLNCPTMCRPTNISTWVALNLAQVVCVA
ncbi:MAG: class I tRNA ligase family protein [Caldilineaceae bacterium]